MEDEMIKIIQENTRQIADFNIEVEVKIELMKILDRIFYKISKLKHNRFYTETEINYAVMIILTDFTRLKELANQHTDIMSPIGSIYQNIFEELIILGEDYDLFEFCRNLQNIKTELFINA